ncbi:MAG TPA: hypothetical protein VHC98_02565 [Candidatus Saccharimonadales bacterium]|nr:hypothetical protein [Candidatus Saccharimonadales bacterium]
MRTNLARTATGTKTARTSVVKRVALGVAGAAAVAVVGSAGIAAAQTPGSVPQHKTDCMHWKTYKFKNKGQCVSWWEHNAMGHGGHGYGYGGNGGTNISTTTNVNVSGNNNVISIVINYIFG